MTLNCQKEKRARMCRQITTPAGVSGSIAAQREGNQIHNLGEGGVALCLGKGKHLHKDPT
jgi:hypothetical protein